jgi:hypothetical protein
MNNDKNILKIIMTSATSTFKLIKIINERT